MSNIIGLSGRMRSGKGELSDICVDNGYIRLYYALPLKTLCSKILGVDINELNKLKNDNENINLILKDKDFNFLSNETGIPRNEFSYFLKDVNIETVRDMLQLIGTDVIRNYDENWHVNKIREMIKEGNKYVIDDIRFPNEKNLVDELGGDCWFIIRPFISLISHHISEESLNWKMFGDNVIINDDNVEMLRVKWEGFVKNYDNNMAKRLKMLSEISLSDKKPSIEPMSEPWKLLLNEYMFKYKQRDYNSNNIISVENLEDGKNVKVAYRDGTFEIVGNPYNIEDLKMVI